MAPKTEFSIPLQKTVNVVTHSRRSNREVRTTEKVILQKPSKKPSLPSGSRQKVYGDTCAIDEQLAYLPSKDIIETHPLRVTDTQEDARDIEDLEASDSHPNVCTTIPPYIDVSHLFADTYGPMAALASQISPPVTGDGGTH